MSRLPWRKSKTLAMLANRRQWQREFSPIESSELEIETEDGVYIITETSTTSEPTYYRTE